MRRLAGCLSCVIVCLFAEVGVAQTADQLRQQLEQLQKKIESLQSNEQEAPNRRVTVIGPSRARPAEEKPLPPPLVTRLYDLGDLFSVAPMYAARQPSVFGTDEGVFDMQASAIRPTGSAGMGGMGMGGMGGGMGTGGMGGMFGVASRLASDPFDDGPLRQVLNSSGGGGIRTSTDQLIDVIKTTIMPDEWSTHGSRIAVIGASLVVTTTDDAHKQIAALLDLFRQRWGSLKTVSIRAWWLWLTDAQLTTALGDARGRKGPAFGALTDEAWDKVRKAAEGGDRPGYAAAVTCYNGQTVFTLAGDHRLVVTGLTPSFGIDEKSGGLAYEPSLTTIQDGAVLQIMPMATRNGKYLTLDVHSRVNIVEKTPATPARAEPIPAGDPRAIATAIERPGLQSQRISTTLRIPVDQPTLVGGMTFGGVKGQSLYLFVQGAVQELRDDEVKEVPVNAPAVKPAKP